MLDLQEVHYQAMCGLHIRPSLQWLVTANKYEQGKSVKHNPLLRDGVPLARALNRNHTKRVEVFSAIECRRQRARSPLPCMYYQARPSLRCFRLSAFSGARQRPCRSCRILPVLPFVSLRAAESTSRQIKTTGLGFFQHRSSVVACRPLS